MAFLRAHLVDYVDSLGYGEGGDKSTADGDHVILAALLVRVITSESSDFMSTIERTEDAGAHADPGEEGMCVESLVLSAHASLLLHVLVDDSVTRLMYREHLCSVSQRTCSSSLQQIFYKYMYEYCTDAEEPSAVEHLDSHSVRELLPRRSWWLPIRLLTAFAALQGNVSELSCMSPINTTTDDCLPYCL